jgi:hypothetical protein
MRDTIRDILAKIESLNSELRDEYDRLSKKYGFYIEKKRVIFLEQFKKRNKSMKFPSWKYVIPKWKYLLHLLSMPFIYGIIIPAIFLDMCLTVYQHIVFRLYGIPRVSRKDYFVYERRFLDYLNIVQKLNCLYCSYVNGLFAYAVEIGARTERYWCPLKAAHKPRFSHGWYKDFADYGNPEDWNKKFSEEEIVFKDAYGDTCFVTK